MSEQKQKFYGWYVVFINMLVLAFGTGLVNNSSGQFLKPLTQALQITRSEVNLYSACMTIAMIIVIPQVTKLFKIVAPRVISTIGVFLVAGGWFSLSFTQSKWHLYACGAVIGVGLSFTATSMVTMIIGKWFVKDKGKALGFALLGSGIGAFVYNPVCAYLIQTYGFRTAYQITAAILFVGMIPYLLGYAFKPEDKGQVALGLEEGASGGPKGGPRVMTGLTYEEAKKTGAFKAVCFIALALNACTIGIYTQVQAYLTDVGYAAVLAATVVSIISLCNAFAKMFFGWLDDKIGTKGNYLVAMAVFLCGLVSMLFVQQGVAVCYIAAVLFGFGLACPSIITPMITMASLGQKDFPAIYSRIASFFFLGSTIGPVISGFVYDMTGSYRSAIIFYIVMLVVSIFIGFNLLNKKPPTSEEA